MTNLALQKDLLCDLKNELCSNIRVLFKLKPMSRDISNEILNKNAFDKLTRPIFNELSYYFMSIIDSHATATLPWPLYDSKIEKLYRDELCTNINNYTNTGLLSSVLSSYLVNPACFKVIKLLYQMSTLAMQRILLKKMSRDRQKPLYDIMTKKYKVNDTEGFVDEISKETDRLLFKFSKYILKYKARMHITEIMRNQIVKMEETLSTCDAQNYIDSIIDGYIEKEPLDETMKIEIQKIKNTSRPSTILDAWLTAIDIETDEMEHKWHDKMEPFLELCQSTQQCTQDLIARHVGEIDRSMYMIEYNPKTDDICTTDLQNHVNMEQKYVLKNIVRDGTLSFPYLIRGFLVAICYILKNAELDDEINKFNECLDNGKSNYIGLVSEMSTLIERVVDAELKIQTSTPTLSETYKPEENLFIPPIPDLTDLRSNRNVHNYLIFDSFTPLNTSKHQFNLSRKRNVSFIRPQPMLTTPFHHFLKEDTLRSGISCRMSSYNRQNISQNFHNISIVPQSNRINETISEFGTGFTKQQIQRLLSTIKRSSSSKKFKLNTKRPKINIKKGILFNESNTFNENNVLTRSNSSPNLFENRERRSYTKLEGKRLSIMQEHLEVSGIVALEKENSYRTPQFLGNSANTNATSLPSITITPAPDRETVDRLRDIENDVNKDIGNAEMNIVKDEEVTKTETPKNNVQLIRKTNSLEKIINRFKRVKANVLSTDSIEESSVDSEKHSKVFKTIVEEKENLKAVTVDVITANRNLLPDLLSPSLSRLSQESTDYLDQICYNLDEKVRKKPRESLGTALGVDQTFLDQFDLID